MNDSLKRLRAWGERIDEMSLRERALSFLVVIGALYALASIALFAPLRGEQVRLEKELAAKRNQIQAFDRQTQAILDASAKGGDTEQQRRLTALQQQLQTLDTSLNGATQGLVSPQEMGRLVDQVLRRSGALQVVRIENLPPTPLFGEKDGAGAAGQQMIYKHGLRMELRGRYVDIVNYLRALEGLPWKVLWGDVSLRTDATPYSTVTLTLYTLSLQSTWLGL